jgi:hypothetical protein
MSDERIEKLEKSLQTLRKQVNELSHAHREDGAILRYAVFACTVAGMMLALTAASWRVLDSGADMKLYTLWGLVPDSWQAAATLGLVLAVALGTFGAFLADVAHRWAHLAIVVLALLAAVAAMIFASVGESSYYADDYETGTGRWLTVLAALVLATIHGIRAGELRKT